MADEAALQSSWDRALAFTLAYEGGYDNDPRDRGGETFRGISRNSWPSWEGWKIIDSAPADIGPNEASLMQNAELTESVRQFYLANFWNPSGATNLQDDYAVALFDFAVHSGVGRAALTLQAAVGAIKDGVVGPATAAACVEAGKPGLVRFLAGRAAFLSGIMVNDARQSVWAYNWYLRLFKLAAEVL